MKSLLVLFFAFIAFIVYSQDGCVQYIADTTEFERNESLVQAYLKDVRAKNDEEECMTIRVVVHVIYDGASPTEMGKISVEQVMSQIRITNQFFANDSLMYHPDNNPLGYKIELARTDPEGNPTTGIIYHDGHALWGNAWSQYGLKYTHPSAISEGIVANALAWGIDVDWKRYLNIYIVHKIDGNNGGGVQAYAYHPTGATVYGTYQLYNTFGATQLQQEYTSYFQLKSYTNLGFTFIHELLHNFGIFHTFQGESCQEMDCSWQGDRVCDTPPQTKGSLCLGACNFVSYNVMDYIQQNCKNRITAGQVARANAAINVNLKAYKVCAECDGVADLNGDGVVNILDFSLLSTAFNCAMGDACYNPAYDLNCDGVINILDFSILSSQFHNVVTVAAVRELPETVELYNIVGQRVRLRDRMPAGVYIVRSKEFSKRVIVR